MAGAIVCSNDMKHTDAKSLQKRYNDVWYVWLPSVCRDESCFKTSCLCEHRESYGRAVLVPSHPFGLWWRLRSLNYRFDDRHETLADDGERMSKDLENVRQVIAKMRSKA